jgi:Xaa-Pro aminopeptidase
VVLGNIPADIKKAVNTAYNAMKVVVEKMKPGALSTELYMVYTDFLEQEGYREFSPYGSVHSLGMLECETPFFSAHRNVEMLENMVIAIDVYFKGLPWGSFRIEDTFIITKDGAECVTTFNNNFIPKVFA